MIFHILKFSYTADNLPSLKHYSFTVWRPHTVDLDHTTKEAVLTLTDRVNADKLRTLSYPMQTLLSACFTATHVLANTIFVWK